MVAVVWNNFWLLMQRGGWVMWPLLALSLIVVTLAVERVWFWVKTNHPRRLLAIDQISRQLRAGNRDAARRIAQADTTIYGSVVKALLDQPVNDAVAIDLIQSHRSSLERFMPTLSTIITTAPMLGILGTVFGIIASFQILSDQSMLTDPRDVGQGIAEALLTTAAGLVVAIGALFPYNLFRAQVDRTLGRIEALVAAAASSTDASQDQPQTVSNPSASG